MSNRLPKRFKTGADMLAKMEHELSSGQRKPPAMYQVLLKVPPLYTEEELNARKSAGPIKFSEDDAIDEIYKHYPDLQMNSTQLNAFSKPYVRRLGEAVTEMRNEGINFGEAYEAAKKAVDAQEAMRPGIVAPERRWIDIVQEEEETILQESMRELRRRSGK